MWNDSEYGSSKASSLNTCKTDFNFLLEETRSQGLGSSRDQFVVGNAFRH
jgi:hypothetical protein